MLHQIGDSFRRIFHGERTRSVGHAFALHVVTEQSGDDIGQALAGGDGRRAQLRLLDQARGAGAFKNAGVVPLTSSDNVAAPDRATTRSAAL